MPTDWLFYWMTLPTGLVAIGAAIALPFFLWRAVLGRSFSQYGYLPLAFAYLAAGTGLLLTNFIGSHIEFSARVAKNVLPEVQRWSIVPGWTIYTSVLALVIVLPLIGLVAVPATALLLKKQKLNIKSISVVLVLTWLALALAGWAVPTNNWHEAHRLQSLVMWLTELIQPIAFVAGAFLLATFYTAKRKKHE